MIFALLLASTAEARVAVRSIDDLRNDKTVAALETQFLSLASGLAIYRGCAKEYGVTQEQLDYHTNLLTQVGMEYTRAYTTAYLNKTGAPPPQKVADYYTQYITAQQQQAYNNTVHTIKTKNCQRSGIRKPFTLLEQNRLKALAEQKNKGKKYDPWSQPPVAPAPVPTPAAPADTTPAVTPPPTTP
jgi:hypothetical protein